MKNTKKEKYIAINEYGQLLDDMGNKVYNSLKLLEEKITTELENEGEGSYTIYKIVPLAKMSWKVVVKTKI